MVHCMRQEISSEHLSGDRRPRDFPERQDRRVSRGTLAASAATFVALTSHILGGGAFPTTMGLIVPLSLSILVCVALAGRRLSLPRLTVSVGTSQTLFHLLFSLFTPTASGGPGASVRSDGGLAALLGLAFNAASTQACFKAIMPGNTILDCGVQWS